MTLRLPARIVDAAGLQQWYLDQGYSNPPQVVDDQLVGVQQPMKIVSFLEKGAEDPIELVLGCHLSALMAIAMPRKHLQIFEGPIGFGEGEQYRTTFLITRNYPNAVVVTKPETVELARKVAEILNSDTKVYLQGDKHAPTVE